MGDSRDHSFSHILGCPGPLELHELCLVVDDDQRPDLVAVIYLFPNALQGLAYFFVFEYSIIIFWGLGLVDEFLQGFQVWFEVVEDWSELGGFSAF